MCVPVRASPSADDYSTYAFVFVCVDLLKRTYQKTVRTTIDAEGRPQEEEVFDDEDPETNGGGQWRRGGAPSLASDTEVRTVPMSDLVELMILHSVVDDQLKVFEPVAPGRTRVILATNIAESSVTIPYVKVRDKHMRAGSRLGCAVVRKL